MSFHGLSVVASASNNVAASISSMPNAACLKDRHLTMIIEFHSAGELAALLTTEHRGKFTSDLVEGSLLLLPE